MILLVSFVLLCSLLCGETAKRSHRLPPTFPQCQRNDPELSKCLVDATEKVRDHIAKGIPELKIPSFEPFFLPKLVLDQGTFKTTLSNILMHGLSKYKFSRFEFDVPNLQFFCETSIPGLELEGDYEIAGKLLVAPIEGKGRFNTKFESCEIKLYQKYHEGLIKGENHIIPDYTNSSIEVGGSKAHLEGLFDGNPELNAITNKAINDNADVLFAELKPGLEETITRIMEDLLIKQITDNIPYNYLYPK